jgi:hypothetical protein
MGAAPRHRFPAGECYVRHACGFGVSTAGVRARNERRGHLVAVRGGIDEPTGNLAAGSG